MTKCFCCGQGELKMKLMVNKNIFKPGETIRGKLDIQNCDIDIKNVEVQINKIEIYRDLFNHVLEQKE